MIYISYEHKIIQQEKEQQKLYLPLPTEEGVITYRDTEIHQILPLIIFQI